MATFLAPFNVPCTGASIQVSANSSASTVVTQPVITNATIAGLSAASNGAIEVNTIRVISSGADTYALFSKTSSGAAAITVPSATNSATSGMRLKSGAIEVLVITGGFIGFQCAAGDTSVIDLSYGNGQ